MIFIDFESNSLMEADAPCQLGFRDNDPRYLNVDIALRFIKKTKSITIGQADLLLADELIRLDITQFRYEDYKWDALTCRLTRKGKSRRKWQRDQDKLLDDEMRYNLRESEVLIRYFEWHRRYRKRIFLTKFVNSEQLKTNAGLISDITDKTLRVTNAISLMNATESVNARRKLTGMPINQPQPEKDTSDE